MVHVLLIQCDPSPIADQVRRAFPAPLNRVELARTAADGLARIADSPPDVVLLDFTLRDRFALDLFKEIRATDARIPVVFVTPSKTADAAIEAMTLGAFDCLFEPLETVQLRRVVGDAAAAARQMREAAILAQTATEEEGSGMIVGTCPMMREVYKSVGRVAAQDVPVLITGESGTGKELIARAIFQHSRRNQAPFFALNCAAIPETLLESELFGHEKGAFTGADRRRIGRFEQCNGGTLFLDEIGDMPLPFQAKMLRLLQEQTFERVGGSETIKTDVRIISATHRDLKTLSGKGQFRADLYYRLGVFTIQLPALRERGDDMPVLVRHFLRRFSRELGRDVKEASQEVIARLREHSWPGNIRELQSILKQAMLQASGSVLLPSMLPEFMQESSAPPAASDVPPTQFRLEAFIRRRLADGSGALHEEANREFERVLLPLVLEHTGGNQFQAAKVLGIARQTLRQRLRQLRIIRRFSYGSGNELNEGYVDDCGAMEEVASTAT
jgi:DNA-binding NtrC family response regulator